jgi:hypothetical protein
MSILPVNMEKEIRGHVDRYASFAALRQRIENDTFMHTTGPAPMINHTEAVETAIMEDGEDESLTGCLNAIQKVLKGKGKGKGNREKPDKGKGKGERVCRRCGKKGHTQPECKSVNDKTRAPLAPGDKNQLRLIKLQHIEEQTEEEDIGSLEVYMNLNSLEIAEEIFYDAIDPDLLIDLNPFTDDQMFIKSFQPLAPCRSL